MGTDAMAVCVLDAVGDTVGSADGTGAVTTYAVRSRVTAAAGSSCSACWLPRTSVLPLGEMPAESSAKGGAEPVALLPSSCRVRRTLCRKKIWRCKCAKWSSMGEMRRSA